MSNLQPDMAQPPQEQTPSVTTGVASSSPTPPLKRSRANLFIVGGALAIGFCLCIGICGLTFGTGIFKVMTETPKVQKVVDAFMSTMANRDANSAYTLFSTRSKRHTTLAEVEKLLEGNNFVLFDGYRSVAVTNLTLTAAFNTDPDLPQGTVAKVEGTISYTGGFKGAFNAVLEQEGSEWRLFGINVTVPPDKFSP